MNILADKSLPDLEALFPSPFHLTYYVDEQGLRQALPKNDILLCRSTLKVTPALLKNSSLQCVATASSGIDHIDTSYLKKHDIRLFDAKGSNARAVTDYVITVLAYLQQQHHVPQGNKAGIIGWGEVGKRVGARLRHVGFDVIAYDPFLYPPSDACLDALTACHLLCLHPHYHTSQPYPSAKLVSYDFLNALCPNTIIINAARGGIVDETALLSTATPLIYCSDVYQNEPTPSKDTLHFATLCTPHIAGHSLEAKTKAIEQLSQQLHAHYQLKAPSPRIEPRNLNLPNQASTWQDIVLSLYHPKRDTERLKHAQDKKEAFLALRQAHHRHDFISYDTTRLDAKIKAILGHKETEDLSKLCFFI